MGRAIQTLVTGTSVIRLIDRDLRNDSEIDALRAENIRVLSRRHIEAYLLDPEVITAFCGQVEQPDKANEAVGLLTERLRVNVTERGKSPDDFKSAAGQFYVSLRQLLALRHPGTSFPAFARESLAPLIKPGMQVYSALKSEIFGSPWVTPLSQN